MTPNNQSDEDSESEFQIQLNIKIKIQILMKIHFDNRKFWLSKIIFRIPFWLEIPNTT